MQPQRDICEPTTCRSRRKPYSYTGSQHTAYPEQQYDHVTDLNIDLFGYLCKINRD